MVVMDNIVLCLRTLPVGGTLLAPATGIDTTPRAGREPASAACSSARRMAAGHLRCYVAER
jgi:hypothetical protein